jgi:hypothetical protein
MDCFFIVIALIQATISKEYDALDISIEISNDVNRDMDLGELLVRNGCHA